MSDERDTGNWTGSGYGELARKGTKEQAERAARRPQYKNDGNIDNILGQGNNSSGSKNIEILRCCLKHNEPYIKLKAVTRGGGGSHILLPMPQQLKSSANPSWEGADRFGKMSALKAISGQLASEGWDRYGSGFMNHDIMNTLNSIKGDLGNIAEGVITDNGGLLTTMTTLVAADFAGLAARSGVAILPIKELRFQGISFRTFNFDWKLIPMDENQSREVEKAIYKLQYHSLPEGKEGFVKYPDLWDISFGPGDPHHVMYMKTCACTSVSVNYSSTGKSVFHSQDLWPIAIDLSLNFTETSMHTKEDVEKGIYG